ncbi:MAG: AbfB domain-containing protein [Chitinophagaceae bacterium]|nr:AbfB domain-containing protein [Chitinophagaceae bacterium]
MFPCKRLVFLACFLFPAVTLHAQTSIFGFGSSWKYLITGTDQGTAWRGTGFSDAAWPSGSGELGYGDGGETTVIGYGPSASSKYITTYFRKTISIANVAAYASFTMNVRRDDGVVVYVNGTEVYRNNMPAGAIAYATLASVPIGDADEFTPLTAILPIANFVSGSNVIAVEMHQILPSSSDLSFDMSLTGTLAANQPPVAAAGADQVIILPASSVTLTGSGSDADGTIATYAWSKVSGPAGGTITSPASAGTTVTGLTQGVYVFRLTVTDDDGATGTDDVQVIVNTAPTAGAGTDQTITLPTNSVTLSGSGTDPDGTISTYAWSKLSGPTGGAITSPSSAGTTVTGLTEGIYVFRLTVTDNNGATGTDDVQVTVNGPNQLPTANAGTDQTIALPTTTVTLSGSGTDPDGTISTYAWSKVSGPATGTITSPSSAGTTITGLSIQGIYVFRLTVTDNSGGTGTDDIQITVEQGTNQSPDANAGTDQIITLPTNSTTLSGSGTDPDGTISTYAWSKVSGPAGGTITSPTASSTTITALVQGVYVFRLTVTDNNGAADTDDIQLTVNSAPTASAGTDQVIALPASSTTLSGSGTDPDGTISTYAWSKVSGPAGNTITSPSLASTTVTGLTEGVYVFRLTVTDNNGATGTDDIQVTVNPPNQAPTANAGADQIISLPASSTTLSGSGTDPDGTISTYAWSKVSGPAGGTITSPASAVTTITGLAQGVYVFRLTVTDNNGEPDTDDVQITVNAAPSSNAGGDQTIALPTTSVTLSGSGTDPDGTISTYAWSKLSGPAGGTIASPSSASTNVTGLIQGVYVFRLTVTDNNGATGTDDVQVTVNQGNNQTPTASAGADRAISLPSTSVTLLGSGADVDGTISTYAWTKVSGPSGGTIATPASANTSITGLTQGTYTFRLTVTDNGGASASDDVLVTVNPAAPATLFGFGSSWKYLANGINQGTTWRNLGFIDDTWPSGTGELGYGDGDEATVISYGPSASSKYITYYFRKLINISSVSAYTAFNMQVKRDDGVVVYVNGTEVFRNNMPGGTIVYGTLATTPIGDADEFTPLSFAVSPALFADGSNVIAVEVHQVLASSSDLTFDLTLTGTLASGANQPPGVNAGANRTITLPTSSLTLTGSSVDGDGTVSTHAWSKISGPAGGTIASPAASTTNITGLTEGTYVFRLTVTDNGGATNFDEVQVTVNPDPNIPPTANAGADQTIPLPTTTATLNGSGTDTDGTISTYAWTKVSGQTGDAITSPSSASTTITGLKQGVYVYRLTVTDNGGRTGTDDIQLTVTQGTNQAPAPNAGVDQTITLPTSTVTLSGSATDADGSVSGLAWTKVSGPAAGTITSPSSASTTVTGLVQGTYVFRLTATDNLGTTGADDMQVTVNPQPNQLPTANAGADQTITLPTNSTTLNGSGTDPDGTITTYAWTKVSGPAGNTISSPSSASTAVGALTQGVYVFRLTVTDNIGATASDDVQVTVNPAPNQLPTANAGSDQTVILPSTSSVLTGSGTDPDGTITGYNWSKVSGPAGGTISSPTSASTPVTSLAQGTYVFRLTVTDNNGATATDDVQINVVQETINYPGQWSAVSSWPTAAVHLILLPNGKVMVFDDTQDDGPGLFGTPGPYHMSIWDPVTNTHSANPIIQRNPSNQEMFCAPHAHFPSGDVLEATGIIGVDDPLTQIYDWETDMWVRTKDLIRGRYYPSVTSLSDGSILVIGGFLGGQANNGNMEIYKGGKWTELTTTNMNFGSFPQEFIDNTTYFPWTQVAPNGTVFYAGPESLLRTITTSGTGSVTSHGQRDNQFRDYGCYAMYDVGKILVAGGGNSLAATYKIDINGGAPVVTSAGNMAYGRRQNNLTILADGSVLVTGGNSAGSAPGTTEAYQGNQFSLSGAVYPAEIWKPSTNTWTTVASMSRARQYHSAALLLPDGRVVHGGGICAPCVFEINAEIYSPPYLFNSNGTLATRPVISSAPSRIGYQMRFGITMNNSDVITKVHLIKLGSVTHSTNFEQRLVPLTYSQSGASITATAPTNTFIAPPGFYMLIAVNNAGVPSVAKILQLTSGQIDVQGVKAFESLSNPGYFMSRNAVGAQGSIIQLPANSSTTGKSAASFRIVTGLSDPTGISFEAIDYPGHYFRHANFLLRLDPFVNDVTYKDDATFYARPGLGNSAMLSFESKNFPGYYFQQSGFGLVMTALTGGSSLDARNRATFNPENPVPTQNISIQSQNFPGHYIRNNAGVVNITPINTGSTSTLKDQATYKIVPGLEDAAGVSFESISNPGQYLRQLNFAIVQNALEGTTAFRNDATFYVVPGWDDANKFSLRSKTYSDRYITYNSTSDLQLGISQVTAGSDALTKMRSTWSFEAPVNTSNLGLNSSAVSLQYLTLTAEENESNVDLNWQVSNEEGVNFYRVERSVDGVVFEPLTSLGASGNAKRNQDYYSKDTKAPEGKLYYRIRALDAAGNYILSNVSEVEINVSRLQMDIYPNPVTYTRNVTVKLFSERAGKAAVKLINAEGRIVKYQSLELKGGKDMTRLDLRNLPSGLYLLEFSQNGVRTTRKLVVQ